MLLLVVGVLMILGGRATPPEAVVQTSSQQQHRVRRSNGKWPSLLFNFRVKRRGMGMYGHTNFSVIANPVVVADETRVIYDVLATFQTESQHCNYTQVNGALYLETTDVATGTSTTQCLQSGFHDFPPINAIVSALNQAKPVSGHVTRCSPGSVFKVTVEAIAFVGCASSSHGFWLYGRDLDIVVTYVETPGNIVLPTRAGQCTTDVTSSFITSIGQSLLTGTLSPPDEMRMFRTALSLPLLNSNGTKCSCKSTPRPCIFVHGLGVKEESPVLETSLRYWGNFIGDHAPCCTSVQFSHLNTVNYTWTNATQQQKVCDRALLVSNSSTESTIKDTIVVTHSMGSLMLAGAIANKRCKLDPSSTWVSTAAPMTGSMASDFAQKVCSEETSLIAEKVAAYKNQCPVNKAVKSLAYQNGSYSTPKLNAAYEAAQEVYRSNVYAAMCSVSYSGILSSYQPKFWVLGELIPHKSTKNDGTVEFMSCAKGLNVSAFRNTYKSRFYSTKLNHYDMQFHSEDAYWNQAKMPLKWFECLL